MNRVYLSLLCYCMSLNLILAQTSFNKDQLPEELTKILSDIERYYPYLSEKALDFECLKEKYTQKLASVQNQAEAILFFEYLLDELYDDHVHLNTNLPSSYRLSSPIFTQTQKGITRVTDVWTSQIQNLPVNIMQAQVTHLNGQAIAELIEDFPTLCQDKSQEEVRTWIANKVLAGRYDQPRVVDLLLSNGKNYRLNLDSLQLKKHTQVLSTHQVDNIGVITIHNSLGQTELISAFDQALDRLMNTQGLIIDLRNTIGGGSSYIARGIMSRFIEKVQAYQKHSFEEQFDDGPAIPRLWTEYVEPRGKTYKAPLVVIVNHWTGSMGEGLAIGFEGMDRGHIMGTEMARLAGAVSGFRFQELGFGYQLSFQRLFHVNDTPREKYIPTFLVKLIDNREDRLIQEAIKKIKQLNARN